MRRRLAPILVLFGAIQLFPSTAGAAATIGADNVGQATGNFAGCSESDCTYVADSDPLLSFASPIDGVVVRWRARAGNANGPGTASASLRVVQPLDAPIPQGVTS